MTYLLLEFKPWAIRHGFNLSNDDIKSLEGRMGHLNRNDKRMALREYIDEWRAGQDACPDETKKEDAGRARANIWLRENFPLTLMGSW